MWDKDHVIGRRFVPKGAFNNQWNIQVNVHKECNIKKSELEDDISAITMQPDGLGRHYSEDKNLKKEAERKGKSISRLTGRPVKDSHTTINIKATVAKGEDFKLSFTSPPQISSARIYNLCLLQMRAFFYFITYEKEKRIGHFWPGQFHLVLATMKDDWGNPKNIKFMETVVDWELRFYGIGADTFYKVIIRRHPDAACWSWAVEWNSNYRVIGFFGEEEPIKKISNTFPDQNSTLLGKGNLVTGEQVEFSYHPQRRLNEDEDKMFYWEDDGTEVE
ncbi:MAG: hypothetical protein IIA06_12170 [Proteobacteria bacterium]|nr:hypothetical protein [Pseudomonadota bacterium]